MPLSTLRAPRRSVLRSSVIWGLCLLTWLDFGVLLLHQAFWPLLAILGVLATAQLECALKSRGAAPAMRCRLLSVVAANLSLFIFSISLGREFGFHHFYLSLAALPLLIFERRERWVFWLTVAVPIVLYVLIEAAGGSGGLETLVLPHLSGSPVASVVYWILLPFRFLFLVVGAFYFAAWSDKAQARINLTVSELKESVRTSRALLAAIPDMIFRVSDEGRFLDYHCQSDQDLFLPPERLVGKKLGEVLPPAISVPLFERVFQAITRSEMQVFSFDLEKGGSRRYYDARIVGSGPNDALMILQDVSERVRSEMIILDQRMKGATANKMAALGEMAGGIAHEINNPLAIIHGKAQQLREMAEAGELDQASFRKVIDRIEQTAMRISKIVKSLRFFARDGHDDPFELAAVRILVNDTLEFCRERFHSHSIDFRVGEISEDLLIECRAVQIGQVLLNLLNNAHDAVEGLAEKWIELAVEDHGERIRIAITDSGHGIPVELREKVFLPFFTTKGLGKGTGLGLSISKGIIEAHQGTLRLDTDCPRTRLVIELPKAQALGLSPPLEGAVPRPLPA